LKVPERQRGTVQIKGFILIEHSLFILLLLRELQSSETLKRFKSLLTKETANQCLNYRDITILFTAYSRFIKWFTAILTGIKTFFNNGNLQAKYSQKPTASTTKPLVEISTFGIILSWKF